MTASWRLRGSLWGAPLLLLGCQIPGERPAAGGSAPPSASSLPAFDCGTLAPYTRLTCEGASPDLLQDQTHYPLADGVIAQAEISLPCSFGYSPCESQHQLEEGYSAHCQVQGEGTGSLRVETSLEGHGACVPSLTWNQSRYGMGPLWQATVSLPGESTLYRIVAEVSATTVHAPGVGCALTIGGQPADPIGIGSAPVFLAFVTGPDSLDLRLDCGSGFAGYGCGALDPCVTRPEDTHVQISVDLVLTVSRCPEDCR